MPIRVSYAPISAYGRAAYQAGRGQAIERGQELALRRDRMTMEQEARNRAFTLQEAAGQRAERTQMSRLERQGRLDVAGFEQMKAERQTVERNLADWETLSGTISEPEYRRGVIAIRGGRTPPYLKQQRETAAKPPTDVYRVSDWEALQNMATDYAWEAQEAPGLEWGDPYRNQDALISQYKQFLADNNYSDLSGKDKQMLELQWEEVMRGEKKFRWNSASREVQQARQEVRAEPDSDIKSEVGSYMSFLEQEGGKEAVTEFRRKWANPANRAIILAELRQRYGDIR